MAANPAQLLLLSDHIKLSLLERQRAISLNLEPNSQDGQISRSLDTLREGLAAIEERRTQLIEDNDPCVTIQPIPPLCTSQPDTPLFIAPATTSTSRRPASENSTTI